MVNRFRVSLVVVFVAIAVIASACAGDASTEPEATASPESPESPESAVSTEAEYIDSVEAISADMGALIEETFDSVFADAEGRSFESLLPEFSGASGHGYLG